MYQSADSLVFTVDESISSILPAIESVGPNARRQYGSQQKLEVCVFWLDGLCQNGDNCQHLHRIDKSKMPDCRHGNGCHDKYCLQRHINEEERKECIFYKQGFCHHGPNCHYRHAKRLPEECPEYCDFFGQSSSQSLVSGSFRPGSRTNREDFKKTTLCRNWLKDGICNFGESCNYAHGIHDLRPFPGPHGEVLDVSGIPEMRMGPITLPPEADTAEFFSLKAPSLNSIRVSFRRGVWRVEKRIALMIERSARNRSILFFSVDADKACYGCAMTVPSSPIITSGDSQYCPEFRISWLRLVKIPYSLMTHFKVEDNNSFPLVKLKTDARLLQDMGRELMFMVFRFHEFSVPLSDIDGDTQLFDDTLARDTGSSDSRPYSTGHRLMERVYVDMVDVGSYVVSRAILGAGVRNFKNIYDMFGGGQSVLKLVLKGIGSNRKEGDVEDDCNEPLFVLVTSNDEMILKTAVQAVNSLLYQIRYQWNEAVSRCGLDVEETFNKIRTSRLSGKMMTAEMVREMAETKPSKDDDRRKKKRRSRSRSRNK